MNEYEHSLGLQLHRLSTLLDRQVDELLFKRYKIGFSQFRIMTVLIEGERMQRDIASKLGQTEASISRQIKLLLEAGYVVSKRDPGNRRRHVTSLSPTGRRLTEAAGRVIEQHYAPLSARFSNADQRDLSRMLGVLYRHVSDLESKET